MTLTLMPTGMVHNLGRGVVVITTQCRPNVSVLTHTHEVLGWDMAQAPHRSPGWTKKLRPFFLTRRILQ